MRVAVFQADGALQSYGRDFVDLLTASGIEAHLFIPPSIDHGYIEIDSLKGRLFYLFEGGLLGRAFQSCRTKLRAQFHWPASALNPLSLIALKWGRKRWDEYDLLIGISKAGLGVAAYLGRRFSLPYIYYSLELYISGHSAEKSFKWQLMDEARDHQGAAGTIIQDHFRWKELRVANSVLDANVFYLPVGTIAERGEEPQSNYLQKRYGLSSTVFALLYFGTINGHRYAEQLISSAPELPPNTWLVLHGPLMDKKLAHRSHQDSLGNLILSTELLPEGEISGLIKSCQVGLALYRTDIANDRHTAFSSQKIALYLQNGLPFIAFRSESYEVLVNRYRCAELIEDLTELPHAVQTIERDYAKYSTEAKRAYEEIYQLRNYEKPLRHFLEDCTAGKTVAGK